MITDITEDNATTSSCQLKCNGQISDDSNDYDDTASIDNNDNDDT